MTDNTMILYEVIDALIRSRQQEISLLKKILRFPEKYAQCESTGELQVKPLRDHPNQ
jgi:hypothetical protein